MLCPAFAICVTCKWGMKVLSWAISLSPDIAPRSTSARMNRAGQVIFLNRFGISMEIISGGSIKAVTLGLTLCFELIHGSISASDHAGFCYRHSDNKSPLVFLLMALIHAVKPILKLSSRATPATFIQKGGGSSNRIARGMDG